MAYDGPHPKLPPCSLEAEQYVLGSLMLDCGLHTEVAGIVSADDFYRADHQAIFRAIDAMMRASKPVDFVTLSTAMRDAGTLEEVGGMSYLGTLCNDTSSTVNAVAHAEIVRDRSQRRKTIALCAEIQTAAYQQSSGPELAAMLAAGVDTLAKQASGKSVRFIEASDLALAAIERNGKRRKAGGVIGAPTGIPSLDYRLGGLYGPRLIILAARPAAGKTALLNQIGFHAARKGHGGIICSLEMGTEELAIRTLSSISGANVTKITHGYDEEALQAQEAADSLEDIPLWIDTETYSLAGICAQIAVHKAKFDIEWAAVDHIGLVETEKFNSRNDQIGYITRTLKQLCKRLQIPIIALSQLNRGSEKENRRPGLADLRDSGNIEQDCDAAIFLHVPLEERSKPVKLVQLGFEKNRGGRAGWLDEQFQFEGATQRFKELSARQDVPVHYGYKDDGEF